jgi:putative serine protease PepD
MDTEQQNPKQPRRLGRKLAPLAVAAVVGAGAGAGVYAATDNGGGSKAAAPVVAAQPAASRASSLSITDVYKKASPGVVDITVSGSSSSSNDLDPFGQGRQTQAEGSGFVIDTKGDIVTNEHVVDGASSITVNFPDGTHATAKLVGSDASSDLAVIKVDVAAGKLHPLTLANSSDVEVGQGVVAIGSPFGLEGTATSGIVSALNRSIDAPNNFTIGGAIQTDAAINHGNSGGPLLNSDGEVIGVNAQIKSDSGDNAGVGFAIPSNTVKSVSQQLIAGGTVEHAFLGVRVGDAPNGGAQLTNVQAGTPAAKAGLKAGDVVVAVDGNDVNDAADLTAAISGHKPGDKVTLEVKSGSSTKDVDVTLGTRPASAQ